MNCAVFYCEKMRGSGRRERQRTGEEPLPLRVREMVLCSLFLQHGFDSIKKDMDSRSEQDSSIWASCARSDPSDGCSG